MSSMPVKIASCLRRTAAPSYEVHVSGMSRLNFVTQHFRPLETLNIVHDAQGIISSWRRRRIQRGWNPCSRATRVKRPCNARYGRTRSYALSRTRQYRGVRRAYESFFMMKMRRNFDRKNYMPPALVTRDQRSAVERAGGQSPKEGAQERYTH